MPNSTDYNAVLWATRGKMYDAITLKAPFWSWIKNKSNKLVAKGADGRWYYEWLVNVKIGSATRIVPEETAFPTPKPSKPVLPRLTLKTIARPMSITSELNDLGQITGTSTVLDNETRAVTDDYASFLEICAWGDGSMIMSTVKSDAGQADNVFIASSCRFLRVGQVIDAHNLSTGAKVLDSREITAINYATHAITFSGYAASLTAGYGICIEDMYGLGFQGLAAIANHNVSVGAADYANWYVTTGIDSYAGVPRSTYSDFKATVLDNGHTLRAFTKGLMTLSIAQAQANNRDTSTLTKAICDGGMAYTIAEACPQNVYVPNLTKEMGWEGPIHFINPIDNKRIEIMAMKTAYPHTIVFLPENDIAVRWTGAPDWKSNNGKILEWQGNMPGGTNTSRGTYLGLMTMVGHNPSNYVMLTDLSYHGDVAGTYPL